MIKSVAEEAREAPPVDSIEPSVDNSSKPIKAKLPTGACRQVSDIEADAMTDDAGRSARSENSRELTKGADLIRIGKYDLAYESVEGPGSKREGLRTSLHNDEAAFLARLKQVEVKVDADGPAALVHDPLELSTTPAAHVRHAGSSGKVGEGVTVQDVAGPGGLYEGRHADQA